MSREQLPLLLGALALLASAAIAWGPVRPADPALVAPWLHRLDVDGDGCVSAQDSQRTAAHPDDFALLDTDGDGCLGGAEVETLLLHVDPKWVETQAR